MDEATIKAVVRKDPTLERAVIPKSSYTGQDTEVASVAGIHANAIVAHKGLNETSAYLVLKVVLGNPSETQRACPFAKEFVGNNLVPRSNVLP